MDVSLIAFIWPMVVFFLEDMIRKTMPENICKFLGKYNIRRIAISSLRGGLKYIAMETKGKMKLI